MIQRIEWIIEQVENVVSELESLGARKRLMDAVRRLTLLKDAIAHCDSQGRKTPDQLVIEEMELEGHVAELDAVTTAADLLRRHLASMAIRLQEADGHKSRAKEKNRMLSPKSASGVPVRLIGAVRHKKPRAFEIDGSDRVEVRTWKEMLVKGSRFLLTKHGCHKHCPEGFFSESPEGLSRPRKVLDGVYVNAEKNSEMIVEFLERLLKALNRSSTSLIIYTE